MESRLNSAWFQCNKQLEESKSDQILALVANPRGAFITFSVWGRAIRKGIAFPDIGVKERYRFAHFWYQEKCRF